MPDTTPDQSEGREENAASPIRSAEGRTAAVSPPEPDTSSQAAAGSPAAPSTDDTVEGTGRDGPPGRRSFSVETDAPSASAHSEDPAEGRRDPDSDIERGGGGPYDVERGP